MPSCFCYVNSATLNIQSLTSESNFKSKRPGSSNLNFYFVPFWYIYNNVVTWREVQYIFILKTHRKTLTKNSTLKPIPLCLKRKNFFQILHLARFEPTTYSRRSSRYRSNHWARKLVLMWESNLCGYSKPKIDHFWMVFKAKKGEKRSRHCYRVFN